jgi:hypothetical protein
VAIKGSERTISTARTARPRSFDTGDWRLATGDWRLATGDWRLATGDRRPATGDWRPVTCEVATGDR